MPDRPEPLPLASEFAPATEQQWRKLVEGVLKGARFEDRLQTHSADGFAIEPLYRRAEDAARAGRGAPGPWQVLQRIDHPDPAACNSEALHELDSGASGLVLIPAGATGGHGHGFEPGAGAIEHVLAGIHLDAGITVALECSPHALELPLALAELVRRRNLSPATVDIHFGIDPIGALASHGRFPVAWQPYAARTVADLAGRGFKGPFAAADGRIVHAAGGTEAQELAFVLATAIAYLRAFESNGMSLDAARRAIAFRLTADADQFLTIAKFRALRLLWQRIEQGCGLTPTPAFVTAETDWRTMTRDDAYANILRATIAAFAAGVGGADAIAILPFTQARGLPDRFARRVGRNTQLVLLQEAHIARVSDPTAGSGWSDDLTRKLCQAAWQQFQEVESAGGAVACLEQGLIQAKVAQARSAREQALRAGTQTLVGANAFPEGERANVPVLDVPRPPLPTLPAVITAEPLVPIRLAAPFEPA